MHSTVTNVINFINENVESAMTVEEIAKTLTLVRVIYPVFFGKIRALRL